MSITISFVRLYSSNSKEDWQSFKLSIVNFFLSFVLLNSRDLVMQFSETCLFVTELAFAYFLMLISMTYNASLFAAVVTGRGMGYYLTTPLVDTYITKSEKTGDYSDFRRSSKSTLRKREPLIKGTDI